MEGEELYNPAIAPLLSRNSLLQDLPIVIISAIVFLTLVPWYEFFRTLFLSTFYQSDSRSTVKETFSYALFVTIVAVVVIYLLLRICPLLLSRSSSHSKLPPTAYY